MAKSILKFLAYSLIFFIISAIAFYFYANSYISKIQQEIAKYDCQQVVEKDGTFTIKCKNLGENNETNSTGENTNQKENK